MAEIHTSTLRCNIRENKFEKNRLIWDYIEGVCYILVCVPFGENFEDNHLKSYIEINSTWQETAFNDYIKFFGEIELRCFRSSQISGEGVNIPLKSALYILYQMKINNDTIHLIRYNDNYKRKEKIRIKITEKTMKKQCLFNFKLDYKYYEVDIPQISDFRNNMITYKFFDSDIIYPITFQMLGKTIWINSNVKPEFIADSAYELLIMNDVIR